MRGPLRGRLTVGRLTLDQVVKVRILAPQPQKSPAQAGFFVVRSGGGAAWVATEGATRARVRENGSRAEPLRLDALGGKRDPEVECRSRAQSVDVWMSVRLPSSIRVRWPSAERNGRARRLTSLWSALQLGEPRGCVRTRTSSRQRSRKRRRPIRTPARFTLLARNSWPAWDQPFHQRPSHARGRYASCGKGRRR